MKGFKMHCINVLGMWEKSQSADGRFLFILKITSAQWLCSNRQSPLVRTSVRARHGLTTAPYHPHF